MSGRDGGVGVAENLRPPSATRVRVSAASDGYKGLPQYHFTSVFVISPIPGASRRGPGPPAEGPGAARRGAWGRPNMRLLDKAPTDYTKPQQTIQKPDILDKAPTDNTKPRSPTISNAPAWYGGSPISIREVFPISIRSPIGSRTELTQKISRGFA